MSHFSGISKCLERRRSFREFKYYWITFVYLLEQIRFQFDLFWDHFSSVKTQQSWNFSSPTRIWFRIKIKTFSIWKRILWLGMIFFFNKFPSNFCCRSFHFRWNSFGFKQKKNIPRHFFKILWIWLTWIKIRFDCGRRMRTDAPGSPAPTAARRRRRCGVATVPASRCATPAASTSNCTASVPFFFCSSKHPYFFFLVS